MNITRSLILVLAIAGMAVAQPPRDEPPQRETDPVAMKARLERWLEETKHREEIITAALKKLSEGASPEDVRKSMEPGTRPQRGGAGGGGGGSGGGPGGQPSRDNGGRARREPPPPHDGAEKPMDREQVLAFIEKQSPEMAARMRNLEKESPDGADRILSRISPQVREILAERDDQTREIRTAQLKNGWEVMGTVREIRDATKSNDTAARAKAVDHMRELLGNGFDLRVRLHEREAAVLEDRLTKLKQELVDERSGREKFIADRLRMTTEPRERHDPKSEAKPDSRPEAKPDQKH